MPVPLSKIIREELEAATARITARLAELLGVPAPKPRTAKAASSRVKPRPSSERARAPRPTPSRQGARSTPAQIVALQGKALEALETGKPMRAGEIMIAMGVDPKAERQRVGRALDTLIREGFVMRLEAPGAPTYQAIRGR